MWEKCHQMLRKTHPSRIHLRMVLCLSCRQINRVIRIEHICKKPNKRKIGYLRLMTTRRRKRKAPRRSNKTRGVANSVLAHQDQVHLNRMRLWHQFIGLPPKNLMIIAMMDNLWEKENLKIPRVKRESAIFSDCNIKYYNNEVYVEYLIDITL